VTSSVASATAYNPKDQNKYFLVDARHQPIKQYFCVNVPKISFSVTYEVCLKYYEILARELLLYYSKTVQCIFFTGTS
jgi:hypothetical protein